MPVFGTKLGLYAEQSQGDQIRMGGILISIGEKMYRGIMGVISEIFLFYVEKAS